MWAVALAVEVSMYTLFADLFGSYPLRVAVHAALFVVFLVLAFLDWRRDARGMSESRRKSSGSIAETFN